MSVLLHRDTRVVVQGITGHQGSFHAQQMIAYGTRVVAGVSPSKAGTTHLSVPVYASVREAVERDGAEAAIVFVPAAMARDAAFEAVAAGVRLLVMIPEHLPVLDTMAIHTFCRLRGVTLVGPNTFGLITPGESKLGIMPSHIYRPGPVGIIARSGTLSYEIAASLSDAGLGQSSVVGMGGDPVVGQTFTDLLPLMEADPQTEAVVLVGEIGGSAEERAAELVRTMTKPVVAYLAGKSAPEGKRMGHAGAIIERGRGTLESKRAALEAAGARVCEMPWEISAAVRSALG